MLDLLVKSSCQREKVYIECLRIFACFLAVYLLVYNNPDTVIGNALYSLGQKSWCIFFMISGSLLLGKRESLKDICIKRVFRIGVILLAANVVILIHRRDFSILLWPGKIIKSEVNSYLAFLYIYILMMICLPLLRAAVTKLSSSQYLGLLIVRIMWDLILYIGSIMGWISSPLFDILTIIIDSAFYMLMGYWVENILDVSWNIKYMDIFLSVIVGFSVTSYFMTNIHVLDECTIIGIFKISKMFFQRCSFSERSFNMIRMAGALAFGIYLLSGPLVIIAVKVMSLLPGSLYLGCIPSVLGAVITVIIYGIIVIGLKCIPGLGRIVRWFL